MIPRIRLIITVLLGSHLFVAPAIVTSQLRSSVASDPPAAASVAAELQNQGSSVPAQPTDAAKPTAFGDDEGMRVMQEVVQQQMQSAAEQDANPPRPPANVVLSRDEVLIRADEQEKIQDVYKVRGRVEIRFRNNVIHCDDATYDSTTGVVNATGHVVYDGGAHSEHITGTHATYNVSRDTGTFYDAVGSTGIQVKNPMMFLRSSTPFFFTGKVVDKLGPDNYKVHQGVITSCQLPKPKWVYQPATATVEVGGDAKLYHSTMRIAGIPVFYFPYVQHPVDDLGRHSGFLIPAIGQSNSKGFIIGDSFYWAINRNMDAEIGGYYFSSRGWAQVGNYRAIGWKWQFHTEYYGVIDEKGDPKQHQNQGGQELKANGSILLPYDFRGVVSVDYLSSYLFRLAFGQSFTEAINSEVRSAGFVSKSSTSNFGGLWIARYQDYQSTVHGDVIDIAHIPSLQLAGLETPIANSRFMYAYDVAGEGVSRHEPGFQTQNIVGRFDIHPTLSMPTFLNGWTFRPEIGIRETVYSERLIPTENNTGVIGIAVAQALNRNAGYASMELRPPSLERIFDRKFFGHVIKHVIEPYAVWRYENGVNNFANIIRFDYRDIVADSNSMEYGVVNRIFAKKTKSNGKCFLKAIRISPVATVTQAAEQAKEQVKEEEKECDDQNGAAKEIFSLTIAQKYFFTPTFGGALVPNQRNVFDSSVDFSGIAFLTQPRNYSPIIFRTLYNYSATSVQWALDFDPVFDQINASTVFVNQRLSPKWMVSAADIYQHIPGENIPASDGQSLAPDISQQLRFQVTYGSLSARGFSTAASMAYDIRNNYLQGATVQSTYNWDCCGLTFEYARWALGPVRNENAYRFAFSLTNVGTFGNLKRLQRIY
jgi:LPS-assembly protein